MLTKKDVVTLKKVFATKQEAKKQHDVVLKKLGTMQGDIQSTKSDIKIMQGDVKTLQVDVKTVKETLNNLVEMTGEILSWTDDIHKEIVMEKLPQRVHRIEKHLGFPVLAD